MMLQKLVRLKPAIMQLSEFGTNEKLQMSSYQWAQAKELADMLEKSYIVSKKMQLEDLTAGYFLRQWTGLKWVLEENGGLIARDILAAMNRREKTLFENPVILAAVFMDAANAHRLTSDQTETAKAAVKDLAIRMKGLGEEEETGDPSFDVPDSEPSIDSDSDDDFRQLKIRRLSSGGEKAKTTALSAAFDSDSEGLDDAVESGLDDANENSSARDSSEPAAKRRKEKTAKELGRDQIEESLKTYSAMLPGLKKAVLSSKNLREQIIKEYPGDLRDAALLLTALPPTQVSVERLFSALKIIKTDHKNRLGEKLLNAQLFLRSNLD